MLAVKAPVFPARSLLQVFAPACLPRPGLQSSLFPFHFREPISVISQQGLGWFRQKPTLVGVREGKWLNATISLRAREGKSLKAVLSSSCAYKVSTWADVPSSHLSTLQVIQGHGLAATPCNEKE